MAKSLPSVDVVIVGFGWTGAIMGQQLTEAGMSVVAIERGPMRDTVPDFAPTIMQDELRFSHRNGLFQQPAQDTLSFRNNAGQTALPMRRLGSFLPGTGVGGAGVHWNGQTWRFLPSDFLIRSHTAERYGEKMIPDDMTIRDWGVTYDELEPHFDQFEYLCGISGEAGNIGGQIQTSGNPFEGARKRAYPLPPLARTRATVLFDKACRELGLHPFACPAANASAAYTNPLGVQLAPCTYCGFCERFACGNYSKASPQTTILPLLMQRSNFELRTLCNVTRITMSADKKRATGVTYTDVYGEQWNQPAALVIVCSYVHNNVKLMLLSGIGKPYDPVANEGVVGRNYAYQITSSVSVRFEDEILNPFIGAGALGTVVDDYNGDNFDHQPHDFIGGGYISLFTTGARPIETFAPSGDAAAWGSAWKKDAANRYLRQVSINTHGSVQSYRGNYLDLDPTYTDPYGDPLLRLTFDFADNDHRMSDFLTDRAEEIGKAMPGAKVTPRKRAGHYSIVPYQSTHNTGGAIMGDNPTTSALNRYLQCWDVHNVFVMGASAFPQNAGYNPTGTVAALAYWSAKAITEQYLRDPRALVQS
jgi:gluconate 2-dehydrogenase alpha chain